MDKDKIIEALIAEELTPLTLDEFIESEKKLLDEFRNYWLAHNKTDETKFPLLTDQSTWLEMFFYYEGDKAQADLDEKVEALKIS